MFKFKGISSEDMQVIIEEEEHFIARASKRYEMTEIEGRDGAIFNEVGYSVVERPIYVQCLNVNKIDDILAWLDGEGEFEYKGRKTTARFYSQLEPQRSSCIRIIDTTFIRDPFWCKANEEYTLVKDRKDKTVEGETIDLTDSADMRFKEFNIRGNSRQETRSGKNKFDKSKEIVGKHYSEGAGIYDNPVWNISEYIEIKSNSNICWSNKQGAIGQLAIFEFSEDKSYISSTATSNNYQITTTTKENTKYVIVGYRNDKNLEELMLEYGNARTDEYEQYGAMPSPNCPSKIKNCGDNVNIFNVDNAVIGLTISSDGTIISDSTRKLIIMEVKPNSKYTFTRKTPTETGNQLWGICDEYPAIGVACTYNIIGANITNLVIKTSSNTKYICFRSINDSGATDNIYYINAKLESGSKASGYSKYGQGCINEVICNKNIFNFVDILKDCGYKTIPYTYTQNGVTVTINENGSITAKGTATARLNLYLVGGWQQTKVYHTMKNLKNITASGLASDWTKGIVLNFLSYDGTTNKSISFQGANNYDYDEFNITGIVIDLAEGTTVDETVMPQLEKGTQATEIIEHKKQVFTIPTQQPMRAIGDVRDTFVKVNGKWYERHYIERKIFDGTEGWIAHASISSWFFIDNIAPTPYYNNKKNDYALCNVAKQIIYDNAGNLNDNEFALGLSGKMKRLAFKNSNCSTVDEWKSYLSEQYNVGTQVYVDYVLETPLDIECTEEQSAILDEIDNTAKSYKGVTHIYSTDDVSPNVEVTYFMLTDETINNEGNIQSRPILRLEKTVSEAVELTINDIRFKYNFENDEYVEIDCEEKTVEYEGLIRNRQIIIGYDYPKLNIGSNKIIMHDGDCIIKVLRKDRWL